MSLRRLHHEQPDSFAFTPANQAWAAKQIAKYPAGRQASAVIPLLWRGQEQEGWVSRPMIEEIAGMLDMAEIRVLEVATFYFMFQLQPVGSVAHIQVCGTTSCMICGAEDLVGVCKAKIAPNPHELSADGKFSWEEVECLGACSNAPMAQIGKDYYEDLTAKKLEAIIDVMARGEVPVPGPQNGRFASEPVKGLTSLKGERAHDSNASISLAAEKGDTVARITGETLAAPRLTRVDAAVVEAVAAKAKRTESKARGKPGLLSEPREGKADNLKKIKGLGPKIEEALNGLGVFHLDQIANWTPAQSDWVDAELKLGGRVARGSWVEQAKQLAGKG